MATPNTNMKTVGKDRFYADWKFKANNQAEVLAKKKLANKILAFYLNAYVQGLKVRNKNTKRRYFITDNVIPAGRGSFRYQAIVTRKNELSGDPESGKDPKKPVPPPPL